MIVDRGFIMVEAQPEFIQWVQKHSKDSVIGLEDLEPSIYLITDDFMDDEIVIKQHFEEIFAYELEISGIDESVWPEIHLDNFMRLFLVKVGVSVFDLKQK
jgi:5-formaminoimidazole-4-carboxamide-1-beta-D-ribofuranosyl 5'-monophosphate synthetase